MDKTELRTRLDEVETQIKRLREEAAQIREEIGQGWDAPTDAMDRAVLLTNVEQQEALIEELEAQREQILRRLEAS